mmetsp:Transcript_32363/g.77692  ORF Transcript_32363/g.77692 Transcript_32363/m.77692 type:complete len:709 (+) Transcript_32363:35-2161(+)
MSGAAVRPSQLRSPGESTSAGSECHRRPPTPCWGEPDCEKENLVNSSSGPMSPRELGAKKPPPPQPRRKQAAKQSNMSATNVASSPTASSPFRDITAKASRTLKSLESRISPRGTPKGTPRGTPRSSMGSLRRSRQTQSTGSLPRYEAGEAPAGAVKMSAAQIIDDLRAELAARDEALEKSNRNGLELCRQLQDFADFYEQAKNEAFEAKKSVSELTHQIWKMNNEREADKHNNEQELTQLREDCSRLKEAASRLHDRLEEERAEARLSSSTRQAEKWEWAHEKVARVLVSLGAEAPRETSPEALVQCADSLRRRWESAEDLAASQSQGLREEASAHAARVADLTASNSRLEHEVRVLRNSLQELKGSVRVLCRMRPPNRGDGTAVTQDGKSLVLRPPQFDRDMEFSFDKVFGVASQQAEVYKEVEGLVRSTLDGFTSMIFAYGQTGSGKTFTIDGTTEQPGVQRRALEQLLCTCPPDCSIAMSVVEVYNDAVRDLLGGNPKELMDVRQSAEGIPEAPGSVSMFGCVSVPGLCCQTVASEEEAQDLLATARANRAVGSTQLNARSSRSHLILSLAVVRSLSGVPVGFLHLCDLAGSERTKLSLAEGDRMKEANHINKSLSALGDVLHALANKSSHVPYRNSKLTSLLRDCLGGNSKVLMLAQASSDACDLSETFSTLSFAARVKTIEKGKITKASHLKDDPPKTKRHH